MHILNNGECDDGNACSGKDACSAGACKAGATLVCNDGKACTNDSCDPKSGCVYTNNTAAWSDGNACTVGDVRSCGTCKPGATKSCNDGNPCTKDICLKGTGA